MSADFLSLLVLLLVFSAASSEKRGKILYSIGEVLRVHQWYFLDEGGNESLVPIARYLTRNGQFAMVTDKFDAGFGKTHGMVVVTNLSFLRILRIIKDDAPECTWMVIGPRKQEWSDELPPLRSYLIFYEETVKGPRLTLDQRPCRKCPLLTKYIEIDEIDTANFQSFFSTDLDFLNNSIVEVSVDQINDCDLATIHDPFMLIQCYHLEIIDMVSTKISFRFVHKTVISFSPKQVLPIFPENPFHFPNGSHGGLFRQLSQRSIDMSAATIVVAKERMHFQESVWPTFELRAKFFVKAGQEEIVWLGYLNPFHNHIWFVICGIIAAGSFTLISITSYLRFQKNSPRIWILFPIFYTLQVLCLQSLVNIPNLVSSRIAYISLLVAGATILPAYSGSLVSFLTMDMQHYPFTTLEEFIADGRFQILTRNPHFINSHLFRSGMNNLTDLMIPEEKRVSEPQDGFSKLCHGWLAYITEDILYTPALQNYPCRITETPVTYLMEYLSISLPKNFPLTEQMRIGNIRARSSGIKNSLEKFILYETRPTRIDKHFVPVILHHVAPMFALLLVSTVLAWVILQFEVLHHKVTGRNSVMKQNI